MRALVPMIQMDFLHFCNKPNAALAWRFGASKKKKPNALRTAEHQFVY
jgi:hypothetical protein